MSEEQRRQPGCPARELCEASRSRGLAAVAASPAYALFGREALGTSQMPPAGTPIFHTLGYVMHDGGHGTIPSDWDLFLQFMRMHLQPNAKVRPSAASAGTTE